MATTHHKSIKRFGLDGSIKDDHLLPRLKSEYLRLLDTEMRLKGYVPRLDINPDFTIQYNYAREYFEFELSVYGIYLGKKKSQWVLGVDETKLIYMESSRSSEYSSEAA